MQHLNAYTFAVLETIRWVVIRKGRWRLWHSFDYILHPPTVMHVPDCPSLSPSQHIFTCRPYLMLFTKKLEIVSPLSVLMTEILWPRAIVSLLSLIFLNVSQLPSLQNLKVCALVHCTLETSTWAKAVDGNVNANKASEMCRNNLFLIIGFHSNFNLRAEVLIVHPHLHRNNNDALII